MHNYSKVLSILLTSFAIPFCAPLVFDASRFGLFFGWEVGTILQMFIAFWDFAVNDFPPHISARRHNRYIVYIIGPIFLSLVVYGFAKSGLLEVFIGQSGDEFRWKKLLVSLFRDSITIIPMVVFFCFNAKFYLQIRRELKVLYNETYVSYAKLLRRVMLTIDIPCLLPYIAILVFSYWQIGKQDFKWETYISGAGSLLLMVSNFLTLSLHFTKDE